MTDEKPLHVQVAEALSAVGETLWCVMPPGENVSACTSRSREEAEGFLRDTLERFPQSWLKGYTVRPLVLFPRYDTDWSATGPLIEKYGITLEKDFQANCWFADARGRRRRGKTPLHAVCHLFITLKDDGLIAV